MYGKVKHTIRKHVWEGKAHIIKHVWEGKAHIIKQIEWATFCVQIWTIAWICAMMW